MQRSPLPHQNRRAVTRIACGIDVLVEYDRGTQLQSRTIDISRSGAQLRFRESPRQRDEAMDKLIIPGAGIFDISKRWIEGFRAGVRFTGPQAELDLLADLVEHLEKMRRQRQGP